MQQDLWRTLYLRKNSQEGNPDFGVAQYGNIEWYAKGIYIMTISVC